MKSTLAKHVSQLMADGRITDGRIYGVQHNKKKAKRMTGQGEAGTNTGSGKNKPMFGNKGEKMDKDEQVNQGAVLKAKNPKVKALSLGTPKNVSKFVKAYLAAKNSLHTSTDSRAKAAGAKPTKGSTAKTKGAGVD